MSRWERRVSFLSSFARNIQDGIFCDKSATSYRFCEDLARAIRAARSRSGIDRRTREKVEKSKYRTSRVNSLVAPTGMREKIVRVRNRASYLI